MTIFITGKNLKEISGTFLKPESILTDEWKNLKKEKNAVLILTNGASTCALALKVWPELKENIRTIVFAGGTLKRGNATQWADQNVYKDPYSVESILNSGIPIVFALRESAEAFNMNVSELAEAYVNNKDSYRTCDCGIHVELQKSSAAYAKMICDQNSDKKYNRKNAVIILSI